MIAFGLNVVIAIIWLLLSRTPSAMVFAVGFVVGFALVAAFRTVVGGESYVRRCLAFVRFVLVFTREFVVANGKVAWMVLFRSRESLHPNFLTYDVTGLTRHEILLLSYCISLTPGTTTVDVSPDFKTLVIHALDADNPDDIRAEVRRTLERSILAFTR
ncbi:MAG TPA: Na+/H+ antiporter subunit E [Verrucomicrobiota bacterium]|nr:Na+/H+ antiporter subunit E [Verrucomicrobiota bacterium]